jgi:hypothetical protein
MTIDGENVFRPEGVTATIGPEAFLVGGWDVGPVANWCPQAPAEGSGLPCPVVEGLAERRGGSRVLAVLWDEPFHITTPMVVVRVRLVPLASCLSDPPGGCPSRPDVQAIGFVWAGP